MPDLPVSHRESAIAALKRRIESVQNGRADIAAGRIVPPERIDSWVATLGTGNELPAPQSVARAYRI
jgi:predicted transcriptional regulator